MIETHTVSEVLKEAIKNWKGYMKPKTYATVVDEKRNRVWRIHLGWYKGDNTFLFIIETPYFLWGHYL